LQIIRTLIVRQCSTKSHPVIPCKLLQRPRTAEVCRCRLRLAQRTVEVSDGFTVPLLRVRLASQVK
jgi:hypothetical protein